MAAITTTAEILKKLGATSSNVGIGIESSSADEKLHVVGDIKVSGGVKHAQTEEETGVTALSVGLASAGWPDFKHILQSVSNGDDPETFNHIYAVGLNTTVDAFHGNATPGKPTVIMGFESYYKDNSDDYGPEWYVEFADLQRPFYARSIFDPATTTIAAGSNGATLPQATIHVASTTNFPDRGSFTVGGETIAYTGKTSTTFTGCSGGTLAMSTGQAVESVFRNNSTVHIDVGNDGTGSFSLFAGKLNTAGMQYSAGTGITFNTIVTFNANIYVSNVIASNSGLRYLEAFQTEDHAGGATITIPADFTDVYQAVITTSGTPTFAAPTGSIAAGRKLTIILKNKFGGTTISGPTWNSVFKLNSSWTNPAAANSRSITFVFDGTNWIEISRTAADVPN